MATNKKKDNYFENLGKEFAQFLRSKDIANSTERTYKNAKSNSSTLAGDASAKRVGQDLRIDLKKERNAKGQLAGALLQGRRYNENGKQAAPKPKAKPKTK
jgi:hypothetical protein